MAGNKKKNTGLIIGMSVTTVFAVALSVASVALKTMANTYLGKGKPTIVPVEGSENWDVNYYASSFEKKEDSTANGEKVTEKICEEGFVLLKNKDDALPLNAGSTTLSLLGRGAVDPLYGGSGSGNVDTQKAATPYSGLKKAGFSMDDESYNYFKKEYSSYDRCSITMDNYDASQWLIGEIAYTDETGENAPFKVTGDGVAIYVLSRAGGEGWDLSDNLKRDAENSALFREKVASGTGKAEYETYEDGQHQLELTKYEKNWLNFCKKNYKKTIVIVNSSNALELGDLEKDDGIDAILWVGGPGSTGFNAMGSILAGTVDPSGRTADIYAADFTKDPTFPNAGKAVRYTDIGDGDVAAGGTDAKAYFTQYEEGIYLGYRYYETRYTDETEYAAAVVYPFGYGLSYTSFEKAVAWTDDGETVTAKVTVKNVGDRAGKDVSQLYYSAPYTTGGIEKSAVTLGDFAKTKLLNPGESDTLELKLTREDMASYDYKESKVEGGGYILEKGDYVLSVRENSHTLCAAEGAEHTLGVANDVKYTQGKTYESGDMLIETQAAKNRFSDISAIFKDTPEAGYATLMSRKDFASTFPAAPTEADRKAKEIVLSYKEEGKEISRTVADGLKIFDAAKDLREENVTMPKMNVQNGYVLSHMRGLAYNDPLWEDYLDQLTTEDYKNANKVLINGAYNTGEIQSLGKGATQDFDGPQGFSSLWGSTGCCAYCSEVVVASTFDKAVAETMGEAIGEESLTNGISGWYGPAMNLHRSPFSGRNFEYYSEDPILSGKIACAVVEGAADKGCYGYIKHFALNDSEIWRVNNLCTWADEQTIRELYLKPFEYVVKNATSKMKYIADENGTVATRAVHACTAVMSSFNRIGTCWAGGSRALMQDVLRDEWGFCGLAISDFNLYNYMNPDQGVRAGTDLQLTWSNYKSDYADANDPVTCAAIRRAYKNMCYTVANSNAMQGVAPGSIVKYSLAWWQILVIVIDVLAGLFLVCGIVVVVRRNRRKG